MTITKLEKGTAIQIQGVPVVLHRDAFVKTTSKTQALMRNQFNPSAKKRETTHRLGTKTALINCSLFGS